MTKEPPRRTPATAPPTTEREETAVSDKQFTAVWTPEDTRKVVEDFHRVVAAMRAAMIAEEYDEPAPVVDLRTRRRIR